MEPYYLPLFLLNCILILLDAAMGFLTAPRLLAGLGDHEAGEAGVRSARKLLSVVVALYMFFNCIGYFQARSGYLTAVTGLVLLDMALQLFLHRRPRTEDDEED